MKKDIDFNAIWLGVGVKSGGQLGFGGIESVTGRYYNLGNRMKRDFSMVSSRWGLGLGGGGGLFVSIYFNTYELYWLNGRTIEDWAVNVSLGKKWKEVAAILKAKNFIRNVRLAAKIYSIVPHLDEIREAVSNIYNATDFEAISDPHPNFMFDVPGAGYSLEVSAVKTKGTMYLDEA